MYHRRNEDKARGAVPGLPSTPGRLGLGVRALLTIAAFGAVALANDGIDRGAGNSRDAGTGGLDSLEGVPRTALARRSGYEPDARPRVVKRFGAARVELLASLANQVGHRLLEQGTDTSWIFVAREPKPMTELREELKAFDGAWRDGDTGVARNLAFDTPSTPEGALQAAERAFRLADRLEGGRSVGALNLTITQAAIGDVADCIMCLVDLMNNGFTTATRAFAGATAVYFYQVSNLNEKALTIDIRNQQINETGAIGLYFQNRASVALELSDAKLLESCLFSAIDCGPSSGYRRHLTARLITFVSSNHSLPRSVRKVLEKATRCTGA